MPKKTFTPAQIVGKLRQIEVLAIRVARRLNSHHVIETPGECMLTHGVGASFYP
jgi:hypothetical protein